MQPDDRVRIEHMIDAAGSIARFIADRSRDDIDADEMLRFALAEPSRLKLNNIPPRWTQRTVG